MSNNQQLALKYAIEYLKDFYAGGNTTKKLDQHYRSQMLGVADGEFDWQQHLKNATKDFNSFDSVKRYCAHQIRMGKNLPDQLRYWIADVLEEIEPTLPQPTGGVDTGKTQNTFLPYLVRKIAVKFDLPATRGTGSSPSSACDLVARAIIKTPEAREIRARSYETIRRDYARAKKNGAFDKA